MADMNIGDQALLAAFNLGMRSAPAVKAPDGSLVAFVPSGSTAHTMKPVDPLLTHVKQSVTLHDETSFVAYVNDFKGSNTRIFAEPGFLSGSGVGTIVAAIDYHRGGQVVADRVAHRAVFSPRYSEQWSRWRQSCGVPMSQVEFAEFIEENRNDIRDPSAAQLLDIVRAFKATKAVEFDSLVYQPDGGVKLAYSEKVEQKGSSGVLPEVMKLGIPVYFRGVGYEVPVWLRFKVSGGSVKFHLKMDRSDVIEDVAFNEIATRIAEATQAPVHLGNMR